MNRNVAGINRRLFIEGAAASAALAATALPVSAQEPRTLRIATEYDVVTWDPIAHIASRMPILRSVFDSPLVQRVDDLQIVPNVVSEWKWLDEGRTLELTFRDDVYFHDGSKLTAEDFRFTYLTRPQQDRKLALAWIYGEYIGGIDVAAPTKAIVHWSKVMPIAIDWMASLANFILPKTYFERVGKPGFEAAPVGSGPYRLAEYQKGSRIVLERFDRYWGERPEFDRVVFDIAKDPASRIAAVQSGAADLASALPIREADRLGKSGGLTAVIVPETSVYIIHLRDIGDFADHRVRLAANHAIDKDALNKALFLGHARPMSLVGVPTMPGFDPDYKFAYDPGMARALLTDAGFGPSKPARITLYSLQGARPNDWEIARAITGMWKQVGIEASLEAIESATFHELNAAAKLPEATLWSWLGPANDPEQFTGTLLNPDSNFSVMKSKEMRAKLTPLLHEFDQQRRIAAYAEADRFAVESGLVIPVIQTVYTVAHKKSLSVPVPATGWYEPAKVRSTAS